MSRYDGIDGHTTMELGSCAAARRVELTFLRAEVKAAASARARKGRLEFVLSQDNSQLGEWSRGTPEK